jgi:hypothetical protein
MTIMTVMAGLAWCLFDAAMTIMTIVAARVKQKPVT